MRKLDLIKKKVQDPVSFQTKIELDQTKQVEKLEELNKSIKGLWELLNDKEDYDFDKLARQLELLNEKLDFTPIIHELEAVRTKELGSLNIKGFTDLLKAVEANKPLPVDLTKLEKAIIRVEQRVQENVVEQSQAAEDFQPVRRVIKVGNRLIYDDQPTPTRGGGGGNSQAVPTMLFQPITQAGAGTTTIVGAVAGKRVKVTGYVVVMGGAGTVKFVSGSTDITGTMSFGANGGVSVGGTEFSPAFETGVGEALKIVTTGAAGNGHLSYFLE